MGQRPFLTVTVTMKAGRGAYSQNLLFNFKWRNKPVMIFFKDAKEIIRRKLQLQFGSV